MTQPYIGTMPIRTFTRATLLAENHPYVLASKKNLNYDNLRKKIKKSKNGLPQRFMRRKRRRC